MQNQIKKLPKKVDEFKMLLNYLSNLFHSFVIGCYRTYVFRCVIYMVYA